MDIFKISRIDYFDCASSGPHGSLFLISDADGPESGDEAVALDVEAFAAGGFEQKNRSTILNILNHRPKSGDLTF